MRIQIMKIFSMSFQNVWSHMLEWFRVAYAPLWILAFGLLFLNFAYWYVGYPLQLQQIMMGNINDLTEVTASQPLLRLAQSVYFITHFIFAFSIYINNIRYGVLQEGGKSWWTLNLNWRFLKMALYAILLGILIGSYGLVAAGIVIGAHYSFMSIPLDIILGVIFFIYGLYLLLRISLYSVLIALDKPNPIRASWVLLKGNVLCVIGLYVLLTLALLGLTLLGFLALGLLGLVISFVNSDLSIALLCLFYFFMFQFIFLAVLSKASALVYQTLAEGRAL